MNRRGDLIDVLPTRPLRTNGGQLDFIVGDRNVAGDLQHGRIIVSKLEGFRLTDQIGNRKTKRLQLTCQNRYPNHIVIAGFTVMMEVSGAAFGIDGMRKTFEVELVRPVFQVKR